MTNVRIEMKMSLPVVNPKADFARNSLIGAVRDELKQIEKMFDRLTAQSDSFGGTEWDMRINVGADLEGLITTTSTPFVYVTGGTSKRHAQMSDRYSPRTQPGSLKMGPHSGKPVAVSKSINKPGIKARDFHGQIADLRKQPFAKRLQRRIDKMPVYVGRRVKVILL